MGCQVDKETETRQIKPLEKALLDVLAFELAQLSRRHPPAVRRQLPVEFAADGQQRLFIGAGGEGGRQSLFDDREPPFQVFQVEGGRRIQERK
jgi:hypothetical protein